MRFYSIDTIPEQFKIFENVQQVSFVHIQDRNAKGKNIHGLDIFKKLKKVVFWGSDIILDPKDEWLKGVEVLDFQKTRVRGITDFSTMPNLQELSMSYSGFMEFPKNIETLKCLSTLTLEVYRNKLALSDIDISKLPCLKQLELQTWYNTMTGIPEGLENNSLQALHIHHQTLTEKEKEIIKLASHQP
ncbi:MAG: leucine-rich repeat domain-containing protein [Flavobacteriales bacterium]|nr:leucine-rich repeat domain-containing protein [Flavobacteriales bacterium]